MASFVLGAEGRVCLVCTTSEMRKRDRCARHEGHGRNRFAFCAHIRALLIAGLLSLIGLHADLSAQPCADPSMTSSLPVDVSTYNGVQAFVMCQAGMLNYTFNFSNTTSAPSGTEYTVDWGNGNTTTYTTNNWSSSQSYNLGLNQGTITLTEPNGCTRSVPFYVFVGDVPLGGLAVITPSICVGASIDFSWSGYTNNPPGTLYTVDFGDGTTETVEHPPLATLQHTYTISSCTQPNGEFTVNWEISNPCDTRTGALNQIRVSEHPVAAFTLSPNDTI